MSKIVIPALEQGTTRVFSLSMSGNAARDLRGDPSAQVALLGSKDLNPKGIEVFPVSDLGELGLTGYLREGIDAREEDITRDAPKLAALDGWVMLVHSLAASGKAVTLNTDTALTLIGTYAQTNPENEEIALTAEAAQPYTGTPGTPPEPERKRGASWVVWAIIALCVIILGAILL
ncbi:hypothetical protein Z946_971 [Sulfitobacter noctilucicola]|uniref:Aspartate carbamoyltransferase catalytic subunit n=1 Tax=Sulfitobacter noctilucicola TaxID=1342301 RepID=A0A7W6M6N2_9RHOB|nr:hypothetical protein [Sulfitobacter noctilucicola]KIN62115.1 hypothetical protein Z946_971 [Sulfitobacter noctilucicola]MBB4173366.1 hypothetical protein [Sulfitobacter noctilucicola]